MPNDPSFAVNQAGLAHALELLADEACDAAAQVLPDALPEQGLGEMPVLDRLAPHVLGAAARLDAPGALAHMDPPTPWITWAMALWNSRLNQNLLHPATAPFARDAEQRVIAWIAPYFGMGGGHMTPGSTLANLTALWAARERCGVRRVVASQAAHLSVRKAAHLLGLAYEALPVDASQRLDAHALPAGLSDAALVLTAGTTAAGAIDPLEAAGQAAWTHVDAAWGGPLAFSRTHASRLAGIERADSVAVSAHKWLFQPKESALVLFREPEPAHAAISFGGGYLAAPNVGVLGSHGAVAVALLATLLAWGRAGLAARIERCMDTAERVAQALRADAGYVLLAEPQTGVVVFAPVAGDAQAVLDRLPAGMASSTVIGERLWLRCVAANPMADAEAVARSLAAAR